MKNLMLLVFCLLSLMSCNTQPDKIYVETSPTICGTFGIEGGLELDLFKDGFYHIGRSSSNKTPGFIFNYELLEKGTYNINDEDGTIILIKLSDGVIPKSPLRPYPFSKVVYCLDDILNNEIK